MKPNEPLTTSSNGSSSQIFLTGAMLFANLDYSGLGNYALKAVIGGAIWMSFKLLGDYLSNRIKSK